jgi:Ser/Thr protein kinase RdoA (MazF antagonist)
MLVDDIQIEKILQAWHLGPASFRPISSGHIHRTFRVQAAGRSYILQRVNPLFSSELQFDIDAITRFLEAADLLTPRLIPAGDKLWRVDDEGALWRMQTFIAGETLLRADSPARCRSSGELLGRFHRALWECPHVFRHRRLGVHDTAKHLNKLEGLLRTRQDHRFFARIEPVGHAILEAARTLVHAAGLVERVVHGDPKISNIVFSPAGQALWLVDLDTIARMPIAVELGDALRSWCSPQGEEIEGPLNMAFYHAALSGYAETIGTLPEREEREAIPDAVAVIAVELAARFCSDALEECYFGWDPARFGSCAEHNLIRARAQLVLGLSARELQPEMQKLVTALWP